MNIIQQEDPKKMKTLFTIDCSASIEVNKLYGKELEKIIDEYYKEGDSFYLWSNIIKEKNCSLERIKEFNKKLQGFGGTDSSLIAKIAIDAGESYREHLLIVTDGKVPKNCIDVSTFIIEKNNIKFKYVTTFIIGSGSNLSVGAPYCRDCPNVTYSIKSENQRKPMASLLPQDIEILSNIKNINNYQQFLEKYENLDRAIQSKMLGADKDKDLIKILEDIKKRIESNIDENKLKEFNEKWNSLNNMAIGKISNIFTIDEIAAAKKQ